MYLSLQISILSYKSSEIYKSEMTKISVYLPDELVIAVKIRAIHKHVTMSEIVKQALDEYLRTHKDD